MQFRIYAFGLLLMSTLSLPALAASAEDLSEVTRLHRIGQTAAALARAERTLVASPKDAQMRFLKSALLVDLGRAAEAAGLLQQLVQDYPELAEPHNNLAAIYAASGQYGKARAELEETLRLNPGYAPAHENLGDVLALLAGQSYAVAQRLEPASAALPRKIALVRQLVSRDDAAKPAPALGTAPAPNAAR